MNKRILSLIAAACLAVVAQAQPTNFGFENGDFTGWSTTNFTSVQTSASINNTTITAYEGTYFALLSTGLGVDVPSVVTQTFVMGVGDMISGAAGFITTDYQPFNDYGSAVLSIGQGSAVLFSANVGSVGDYGNSGWTPWSYTATAAGSYTLTYSVANSGDNAASSYAYVDASQTNSVPDATSTFMLAVLGFGAVAALRPRL